MSYLVLFQLQHDKAEDFFSKRNRYVKYSKMLSDKSKNFRSIILRLYFFSGFSLHSFLVVGKKFYAILMQSCRFFFSPDLFMKISNFSKTVHTIVIKFCKVILHPKEHLRAQRHFNRMTGI